eukprot:9497649-Pyramimonas_sp.AAC.2
MRGRGLGERSRMKIRTRKRGGSGGKEKTWAEEHEDNFCSLGFTGGYKEYATTWVTSASGLPDEEALAWWPDGDAMPVGGWRNKDTSELNAELEAKGNADAAKAKSKAKAKAKALLKRPAAAVPAAAEGGLAPPPPKKGKPSPSLKRPRARK